MSKVISKNRHHSGTYRALHMLMPSLIFILTLVFSPSSQAASSEQNSPAANPYGIGSISQSNQIEYERFEGAFYVAWNPISIAQTHLKSDSGSYTTDLASTKMNGINLGVRHSIASFGRFALLGDYGVSVNWISGNFQSVDSTQEVSASSSTSNLMAIGLAPALLMSYFLTDKIHPFLGAATAFYYSRLQSPLAGGDNEYFELHYGPAIGLQIVNLPFQNLFFSAEWIQLIKQGDNANRLYADNGHAELALGLNF
jgi:hypothetical protein